MRSSTLRSLFVSTAVIFLMLTIDLDPGLAQTGGIPEKPTRGLSAFEPFPRPDAQHSPQALRTAPAAIDPIGLEEWSRIAFQSYYAGNWEIYFGAIDGQNPTNITNHYAADARPALNRGGTAVLFNSDRDGNAEIYRVNIDGTGLTRLTYNGTSDYAPAWSPDGSQVVFVSDREGNLEIYKMNIDGSGITRLTNSPHADTNPSWSPDGTKIAWTRSTYDPVLSNLYKMGTDGSNQQTICLGAQRYVGDIEWSPDSASVAVDYDNDHDGWNEIVSMTMDGGNVRTIYDANEDFVDSWMGGWSPDQQWVIITRIEYYFDGSALYIANAYLERHKINSDPYIHTRLAGYGVEIGPVWQSLDVLPPISSVKNLPAYSLPGPFTVNWSGTDTGVSGFYGFDVQFRYANMGGWNNWLGFMNTPLTSGSFQNQFPGYEIFFRSRAKDRSYNVEAWPDGIGDTSTRVYSGMFEGYIRDIRSRPVIEPSILIQPSTWEIPVSNLGGFFSAHKKTDTMFTLSASQSGYGALPEASINSEENTFYELHLPPQDNLLQNGDFEEGTFDHWQLAGNSQITIKADGAHTGTGALNYDLNTTLDPTNLSTSSDLSGNFGFPQLMKDPEGLLHAVWHDMYYSGIVYSQQLPWGAWTSPLRVGEGQNQDMAMAPDGTLHMVWIPPGYENPVNISYASKEPGSWWSEPVDISGQFTNSSPGASASISVDPGGNVHVIWGDADKGLMYARKPNGSSWTTPNQVFPTGEVPDLAVDKDSRLHLVWMTDTGLYYSRRSTGGNWSTPELISNELISSPSPKLTTDDQGNVFLIWGNGGRNTINLSSKSAAGEWSEPIIVSESVPDDWILYTSITAGGGDHLHMAWSTYYGNMYYRVRYPDGLWSVPLLVREGGSQAPYLSRDNGAAVNLIWYEDDPSYLNTEVFYSPVNFPRKIEAAISQTLHIGANMNRPTLSFAYRIEEYNGQSTNLSVRIGEQPVFSTVNTSGDWSYAWVDLSEWLGQTIALTFASTADTTDGFTQAMIDEISVGSWLTPVVNGVNPSSLAAWGTDTITIHGENFISPPVVYLNGTPVPNVTFIDEHTIQAALPPGLGYGSYDVWVHNPGGQRGVLAGGLRLGSFVFLPMAVR